MAMTHEQRREAAAALLGAENTRQWIDPITDTYPGADIEDAYAIGQLVTDAKLAAGRVIKGHKVGLTSAAMRSTTGATEPDFGTLFDDRFIDEGSVVPASRLNLPLVEIEIVFVLKRDLGGPDVNVIDVMRATDFILPAIEVVDRRYNRRSTEAGVVDSIADAASCGFVIMGGRPAKLTDVHIGHIGGALYLNGELAESGIAAAVMGNPLNSVAWLARKLDEFGIAMSAGQAVLSGSFIRARTIRPGDAVVADFGPLGQITFGVADPEG